MYVNPRNVHFEYFPSPPQGNAQNPIQLLSRIFQNDMPGRAIRRIQLQSEGRLSFDATAEDFGNLASTLRVLQMR